jgi:murein L,D-transpeptidase YafK
MAARMKISCRPRLLVLCLLVLAGGAAQAGSYNLVISKSERLLQVREGDKVIKAYHIAFGKGGKGAKREMGDNKTPVGIYHIIGFKPDSKFYYFMQLDYPNLIDAWHGYMDRLISARQFKAFAVAYRFGEAPPQDTMLGGYIGIHGIGEVTRKKLEIHSVFNWTDGCIAMKNREIHDLRRFVTLGTRVTITE